MYISNDFLSLKRVIYLYEGVGCFQQGNYVLENHSGKFGTGWLSSHQFINKLYMYMKI